MSSTQHLLVEAIAAFNYPEEMGEHIDDSVQALAELKAQALPESHELKLISYLHSELCRGYEVEANRGPGSSFTLARLTTGTPEPALEMYNHRRSKWMLSRVS